MRPRNSPATVRRVRSALWAAYGDALGFPTELVDLTGVKRRIGADHVSRPVAWTRRVGGRFGVNIKLPEGCYSDDTQLRLATSRAIRSDGSFDVEAFSKIELSVWSSYALGGGRGTKAAAAGIAKRSTSWVGNFGSDGAYASGGGNGAAMRIQPHVWASPDGSPSTAVLPAVIRNAICTHGHFRGILGACFHALLLGVAIATGKTPSPQDWFAALDEVQRVPELVRNDDELRQFWVPAWERISRTTLAAACDDVVREMATDVSTTVKVDFARTSTAYRQVVEALDATHPDWRGSGTRTALLAAVVAHVHSEDPEAGVLSAANAIGTDTDTIATMAGALLGASSKSDPPGSILDRDYIAEEASRLALIAASGAADSFPYPDLLRWTPPRSQLEVVGQDGNRVAVMGLGYASPEDELHRSPSHPDQGWQMLKTDFGQTLIIKRRAKLGKIPPTALPYSAEMGAVPVSRPATVSALPEPRPETDRQPRLFPEPQRADGVQAPPPELAVSDNGALSDSLTLHEATKLAWGSQLDPAAVGNILLSLAGRENGIELAMGFAAIVAKAKKTQEDRERRKN